MNADPRNPYPVPAAMADPPDLDWRAIWRGLDEIASEAFRHATAAGFWANKDPKLAVFEKVCLIHAELSEGIEHLRHGRWQTTTRDATEAEIKNLGVTKVEEEGFIDEMADAVIRIGDLCAALGFDLGIAVYRKHMKTGSVVLRTAGGGSENETVILRNRAAGRELV